MNRCLPAHDSPEPERYELRADRAYHFDLDRRDFFRLLGGGIVVLVLLPEAVAQESGGGRRAGGGAPPQEIGAWLHINEEGRVTAYTGKVEFGQNIRTSLAQAVAEELRVPPARVDLVMGDTDLTPFDRGTFGSRTTPAMAPQLHKAAAAARDVLIGLAAEQWKVDRASLVAADGKVIHTRTRQALDFGQLAKGRKLTQSIGGDVSATPAGEWKVAGTSVPKSDGRSFVTGRHQYTSDRKPAGTLYGSVLRPEAMGATLASLDTRGAEALPGVIVVRDGDFVGVAAPRPLAAARALQAIRAEWKTPPQPSGQALWDLLKTRPAETRGFEGGSRREQGSLEQGSLEQGSLEQGLAASSQKLRATYTVAYIAHAPMEPRAAVAEWDGSHLTVWTGTQRPFGVRGELAAAFHLPENQVRVIVPDTGSGYGGKHTGEAAIEAARLAKAAGKPVKIVWTREEEFTWAYFRPAGVIDVASGAREDGFLQAWEFHNYNSGASALQTPYSVPNQRIAFHPSHAPLRQGSYRGLAATANHFARETHMDELAHALKMDPLAFRLKNLRDARLRAVFEAAAARFGWGKPRTSSDRGFGIAGGFEKGGYVATCAEVAVDAASGKVAVVRMVAAFECGAIVNPNHLKNQIEGAVIMGLGGALFEAIQFDRGKILNPRFSRYRVPRFGDIPVIEVVLIDRRDLPSMGAGETPIVGVAPAIGNAIFDVTGTRLRSLPLAPKGLKV